MEKADRIFLIAVDGPDLCGKSTFVKKLAQFLISRVVDLYACHFPDYETTSGNLIYNLLRSKQEMDETFTSTLTELNMYNRYATMKNMLTKLKIGNQTVFLCDRYMRSNEIHNALRDDLWINRADKYFQRETEAFDTPTPNLQIYTYIDQDLQLERLRKKKDTDNLESFDVIHMINQRYKSYMMMRKRENLNGVLCIPMQYMDASYQYKDSEEEDRIRLFVRLFNEHGAPLHDGYFKSICKTILNYMGYNGYHYNYDASALNERIDVGMRTFFYQELNAYGKNLEKGEKNAISST